MKSKRSILFLALLLCALLPLDAQSFQEGFFLSDYRTGYRFNPALQNPVDFLSVGDFSKQARTNVGERAKYYPVGGSVVTALHSSVPAETFLANLQPDNYKLSAVQYNLFSYGMARGAAYHTFEAGVHGNYSASVPIEVFEILKKGTARSPYDLSDAGLAGQLYAELAYGYSRDLDGIVTVGFRSKLLLGLNAASYRVTKLDLTMDETEYTTDIEARFDLTNRSKNLIPDEEGFLNPFRTEKNKTGLPSGVGLALDFGVVIRPNPYLTLSASMLNLGGILWHYGNAAESSGTASFTGLKEATFADFSLDGVKKLAKDVADEYVAALRLRKSAAMNRWGSLPVQWNAAAKYTMPFWDTLSVGAVASYTHYGAMPYWDARGAFGLHPFGVFEWVDFTANAGWDTFGPVYGWALGLRLSNFRLSVGRESSIGPRIPDGDKLDPHASLSTFGLTYDLF